MIVVGFEEESFQSFPSFYFKDAFHDVGISYEFGSHSHYGLKLVRNV